jgi:hypothetical protein
MGPEILAGAMMARPEHFSFKRIELAYWGHESFGLSPAWRYLAERALIEFEDWSNYNMSARFKAGAMGLPFLTQPADRWPVISRTPAAPR